jgi:nitrate/nitrite-specific signal transduction histidine kinase
VTSLTHKSLVYALNELAGHTSRVSGRRDFLCPDAICIDDHEVGQHPYPIAEEAVGNSTNHANAARIEIRPAKIDNRFVFAIRDNNPGLPKQRVTKNNMGLRIMPYRAGVTSWSLIVQREPGDGTAVLCSIPERTGQRRNRRKS